MDFLLAFVFFVLAFVFLYISKFIYRDYLSPIGIFGFVQSFSLALFFLKLLPYKPLGEITWICFITGLLCFSFGCIIVSLLIVNPHHNSNIESFFDERKLLTVIKLSFIFGFFGFVCLIYFLLRQFDLNTLIHNQNMVRENFVTRFITYPWFFNVLTPSLTVLYWKIKKKHKFFLTLIFILSLIMLILSFSRSLAIQASLMAFLSANYFKFVRKPFKSGLVVIFVIIIAFSILHSMRRTSYIKSTYNESVSMSIRDVGYWIPVYGYFTNGLSIFEKLADDTREFDHGTNTFITIFKFLKLFGYDFDDPGVHGKWYANPIRGNVYTYLGVYYKDFGLSGVIVLSFFQGVLVMVPYLLMSKNKMHNLFLINSVFGYNLMISFFSNHFRGNTNLFLVLISLIIGFYIKKKAIT